MSRAFSIVLFSVALQVLSVREIVCGPAVKSVSLSNEEIARLRLVGEDFKMKLTPNMDPCEGFYCYAFKSRNGSTFGYPHLASDSKVVEILEDHLQQAEILTDPEIKLKTYLESCKQTTADDAKQFLKDFNFPDSIGGWPAFDPNWNAEKFHLQRAIAELKSYSVSVIIDQAFDADQQEFQKNLAISAAYFRTNYDPKAIDQEILTPLGVRNSTEIIADFLRLERECNEIISTATDEDYKGVNTDFSGLKEKIPEIDWDLQTQIIFGQKLRSDYPVVIKEGEILRKIIAKVSSMDPKIVANHFFLKFARDLSLVTDPDKDCLRYAVNGFKSVVSGIVLKRYFPGERRSILSGLLQSTVRAIQESFHTFRGMSTAGIEEMVDRLVNEEFLPRFSDDQLKKEYGDIHIDPKNFFQNMYALREHQERTENQYVYGGTGGKVEFINRGMIWILQDLLYEARNKPSVLAYDALAYVPIAEYGDTLSPEFFNDSLRECLSKQLRGHQYLDREVYAEVIAQIFTKTYFDWADKNKELVQAEDEILREYGLSSKKLVFIRLMEYKCILDTLSLESSFFWNSQEFAETFSCPLGTEMNPVEKCHF